MALPTAVAESAGLKVLLLADSTATTPAASQPAAVARADSGHGSAYRVGWIGVATHRDGDTFTQPGGFATAVSGSPICVAGGIDAGGLAQGIECATGTPGGTAVGMVTRNIPSGTQAVSGTVTATPTGTYTVSGTVAATQSGTWNVGTVATVTAVTAVTAITNALPAGGAALGAMRDFGWDHNGLTPQRGLSVGTSNTTENTLLSADASNQYNVVDIEVNVYTGTTAPAAGVYFLSFRHGVAGTEFYRYYIPTTQASPFNYGSNQHVQFRIPSRGSNSQAVTVQLNSALGTSYQYSVVVHAYKTP